MTRNRIPVQEQRRRHLAIAFLATFIFAVILVVGTVTARGADIYVPVVNSPASHWSGDVIFTSAAGGSIDVPSDVVCGPNCGLVATLPANGTKLFPEAGASLLTRSAFGTFPAPSGFAIAWTLTYDDGPVNRSYSGPPIGSVTYGTRGYFDAIESSAGRRTTITALPRDPIGAVIRVHVFDGGNNLAGTEYCNVSAPVTQCQVATVLPGDGEGRLELDVVQGGSTDPIPIFGTVSNQSGGNARYLPIR